MKIEKRIHQGYEEFENCKIKLPFKCPFGKYQYVLTKRNWWFFGKKKRISLIKIRGFGGEFVWEIYSWNKLFENTEKFDTGREAVERIKELLK